MCSPRRPAHLLPLHHPLAHDLVDRRLGEGAFDGAEVEYEEIYHREDGSERIGSPRRLPIQFFIEETFGGWYPRSSPPPAPARAPRGLPVPMKRASTERCQTGPAFRRTIGAGKSSSSTIS